MDERYRSLNSYLRSRYGEKVYKLALNGGMTCPNRDGTLDTRGCIFCSAGGSGEFAELVEGDSVRQQVEAAKQRLHHKQTGTKYIAYFQAYTNTYASAAYLRSLYLPVLELEEVVGLSIGTRPDCLPEDVLELLEELNQIKPIWVELGLQTIHEHTAQFIRRGYALPCFDEAVQKLQERHIEVVVHLIFGLPGETKKDMLKSVRYVNQTGIQGVKLQLLHILEGTDLATIYRTKREVDGSKVGRQKDAFHVLTMEEYIDILCDAIGYLSPEIVVHRLTGDGPKKLLLAPKWSADKKKVLNAITRELVLRDITQGCML